MGFGKLDFYITFLIKLSRQNILGQTDFNDLNDSQPKTKIKMSDPQRHTGICLQRTHNARRPQTAIPLPEKCKFWTRYVLDLCMYVCMSENLYPARLKQKVTVAPRSQTETSFDLWPWKPFQTFPLTWRILVRSFTVMHHYVHGYRVMQNMG